MISGQSTWKALTTMDAILTWLVRTIHILGAACWLGGYAVMLLVIVPALAREHSETIRRIALTTARVLSISGAVTVLAGLALIWRTRGYGFLFGGEWGGIVVSSFVLAIVMGGIGDALLRPAIRRLDLEQPATLAPVRRWTWAGLLVGVLILLLMTRAIYART
jgi:putative copper export protein